MSTTGNKPGDDGEPAADSPPAGGDGSRESPTRQGTGRLSSLVSSSLVPSLERWAGTAASASHEAARYTTDKARRYGHKVQWHNRSGKAPPGHADASSSTTKVDWSGVGSRFCTLSWYERRLVGDVAGLPEEADKAAPRKETQYGKDASRGFAAVHCSGAGEASPNSCEVTTLEDADHWVTGPIYDDESNAVVPSDPRSAGDGVGVKHGDADVEDGPSPTEDGSGNPSPFFNSAVGVPERRARPSVEAGAAEEGGEDLAGAPAPASDAGVPATPTKKAVLKPVLRKSAVVMSSLLKKGTVAAAEKLATYAGGSGGDPDGSARRSRSGRSSMSSSSSGGAGTDDPEPRRACDDADELEFLKRRASEGDGSAHEVLRRRFGPPSLAMGACCQECGEEFGVRRYRHHCKHCGGSFCQDHAPHSYPIPKMGLPAPQRVCTKCRYVLEQESWRERVDWRQERASAYLKDQLVEYFDNNVDTNVDKAWRVMDGAIFFGKSVPLGSTVKVSLKVLDVMRKFGTAGIAALVFRKEFVEAVNTLRLICGVDKEWAMSVHETSAAMFYIMAQRRGERGDNPDGEHEARRGCPVLSDGELAFLRRISPVPLYFAYRTTLEMQVLCGSTGWSLVFHKAESDINRPSFALMASRKLGLALLTVRGTKSLEDMITDSRALPVAFPPPPKHKASQGAGAGGQGEDASRTGAPMACAGMARAAEWLHREVLHALVKLRREGQQILISGHSLGAGVAVLLGPLVRQAIPDARVVAFATPACANLELAQLCEGFCTNVILHDDILPRVTPRAVRVLLDEAKSTKEEWSKHLQDDMDAVVDRAKGLWAPLRRTTQSSGLSADAGDFEVEDIEAAAGDGVRPAVDAVSGEAYSSDGLRPPQGADNRGMAYQTSTPDPSRVPPPLPPRPKGMGGLGAPPGTPSGTFPGGVGGYDDGVGSAGADLTPLEGGAEWTEGPLQDLYVPGRIVHIYSQRGVYRACEIPRDHECLRTFPMYGNTLEDHDNKTYFRALEEVEAVRKAEAAGARVPEWVPFSASDQCQLCKADFFWASTLRSEAQRARDKHNCRMCGILVCPSCSQQKKPLPQYGVTDLCRVCDQCFYGTI